MDQKFDDVEHDSEKNPKFQKNDKGKGKERNKFGRKDTIKTGFNPNRFSEVIQFSSNPISGLENEFAQNDAVVTELSAQLAGVAVNASNVSQSGANNPVLLEQMSYRMTAMVYAKKTFFGMSSKDKTIFGNSLTTVAKAYLDIPAPLSDSFSGVGKFNFNGCDFVPVNAPLICFSTFAKAVGTDQSNGLNLQGRNFKDVLIVNQRMTGSKRLLFDDLANRYNHWARNQVPANVAIGANAISMKPPEVASGFGNLLPVLANFNVPPYVMNLIAACAALEPPDNNNWANTAGPLLLVNTIIVDWDKDTQSLLMSGYTTRVQQPLVNILAHAFEIERNVYSMPDEGTAWQLMEVNDAIGVGAHQPFKVSDEQRMRGLMLGNKLDYVVMRHNGVHSSANAQRPVMRHIYMQSVAKNDQFV